MIPPYICLLMPLVLLIIICIVAMFYNWLSMHPYTCFFNPGEVKLLYWAKQKKLSVILLVLTLLSVIVLKW